jgi:hypothetical protein
MDLDSSINALNQIYSFQKFEVDNNCLTEFHLIKQEENHNKGKSIFSHFDDFYNDKNKRADNDK